MKEKFYLTVGPHPRHQNELLAVVSDGSPRYGDTDVTVFAVEVFKDEETAVDWYARMIIEQPWKSRQ